MTETIRDFAAQAWSVLAAIRQTITVWDIIDILIIAFLIYRMLSYMQKTRASSVIRGLILVLLIAWLANIFNMNIISYLLGQALQMGIIVIVVLFQPEIRKIFERVGSSRFDTFFKRKGKFDKIRLTVENVITACFAMKRSKTGAIIVFERQVGLNDYVVTGVAIDAEPTSELIQSIFYENTPLHDGALIIRNDRVLAASCMLPLSTNYSISKNLGMRHRAAVGLTERSDAIVVVVSEQTGDISVAVDGMLKQKLSDDTFEKLLIGEIISGNEKKIRNPFKKSKDTANEAK